jgi:hypothetical protein
MTTELTRKYEPFADCKWVDAKLIAIANDIQKAIPEVQFKQGELYTYNIPEECKPVGVTQSLDVYFEDDPNNRIGVLGIDRYNDKYFITNRNIPDGRRRYGRGEGETKESKHAKNIINIAKKTLKPLNILQVMDGCKRDFEQNINSIRTKWSWEVNRKTDDAFKVAYEDMIHLKSIGYEPRSPKFKNAMEYLYENRANIDKYSNYDPQYYFVWLKPNCVEFITRGENVSKRVASLNDLPEQIRGKMFVLDISDEKQFIEDVGRKENKTAYWVMT